MRKVLESGRIGRLLPVFVAGPLICAAYSASAQGFDLNALMQGLDRTEQELVTDTLSERVPEMMLDEDTLEFGKDLIDDGKTIFEHADLIAKDKHREFAESVAGSAADATAEELAALIESRYPDEDSPVRELLSSVQNNPDEWKAAAKAVLDVDPKAALAVLAEKLTSDAAERYEALVEQGKTLWKDMARGTLPGAERLQALGIDPVETYLDGVEGFADGMRELKQAKDNLVLDCLHRRYHEAASAFGSSAAREEIESLGLSGYSCAPASGARFEPLDDEESGSKGPLRGLADIYRTARDAGASLTTESTTLAELGISRGQAVDLIEAFETAVADGSISRTKAGEGFSAWAQTELRPPAQDTGKEKYEPGFFARSGLGYPIGRLQKWSKGKKAALDAMIAGAIKVIERAVGVERFTELSGLPSADALIGDGVLPFTQGRAVERVLAEAELEAGQDAQMAAREAEEQLRCDPEAQRSKHGNGNLDPGFIGQETAAEAPGYVDTDECRPYGKAGNQDAGDRVAAEDGPGGGNAPRQNRCAQLGARMDSAAEQYVAGRISEARASMDAVNAQLHTPAMLGMCPDLRSRLARNIPRIERMQKALADVGRSLTECSPDALAEQAAFLQGARNPKLVALNSRIARARPIASVYTEAKSLFSEGRIGAAESKFLQALAMARAADGLTCEKIKARLESNLHKVRRMRDFDAAATRAIDTCDMGEVGELIGSIAGAGNPYLDAVYGRLASVPADCLTRMSDAACKKDYGPNAVAKPASGESRGVSCDCRSGYQFSKDKNGNHVCMSNANIARAEQNELNANCRNQSGRGYYAGPRDKQGNYYCLPDKATANAWCRNNGGGSGSYAGKIQRNGGFKCYSKSAPVARSRPSGNTNPRRTYSQGQRDRDAANAAAAAQALGAILQGIDAYQQAQRGGDGGIGRYNPGCRYVGKPILGRRPYTCE